MIRLFGQATDRLCQKLDKAASDGEDVEMESLFSRLTLDVIGKALFNYDFDSLTNDTGIVEVSLYYFFCMIRFFFILLTQLDCSINIYSYLSGFILP